MSEAKRNITNPLSMDTALFYYSQFMDNFSFPHTYNGKIYTYSIPSSFVYNAITDGCLWLITLIMGVAGYSIYFDDETTTSRVLSLSLLNQAGVKDPAILYNSSIEPWSGLLADGRSPLAPTDKMTDGLGIAYLNGGDLLYIYRADPLQAILPYVNPTTRQIEYIDGIMQVKKYSLCTTGETGEQTQVYGWGMSYNNTKLPLDTVSDNTLSLCYMQNTQGIACLKSGISGQDVKCIGSSFGERVGKTRNLSRLEFSPFNEYAKYHLNLPLNRFYIPLYWMAKNWAPFISWHNGTQTNSLQAIMMASAVSTFNKLPKASLQGKTAGAIATSFMQLGLSQKQRDQFRIIVANTQRAITLLEFLKRL